MAPSGRNLRDNFAPVTEERSDFDLRFCGRLPVGLKGQYVRTGANPKGDVDPARDLGLASPGMVHGTLLGGGRALGYRNRWIRPPSIPRDLERELLLPAGNGAAALFHHAGQLHATAELGLPCRLSSNLDTLGLCDFGGPLPAGAAPHVRTDPRSGELHILAYHFEAPYLRHHRIDRRGHLLESRDLEWPRASMVHDFALTESHLVVFDLPVLFSEDALLDGQPLPYRWHPDAGARIGLLSRRGPVEAQWFDLDPCWVTHLAGARRDETRIVVDMITAPTRFQQDCRGEDEGARQLVRCTLDPRRGVALPEVLDADAQDNPARDTRVAYADSRWLWTTALVTDADGQLPAGRCVYRHDLKTGERIEITFPDACLGSEMTFVPADPRAAEGKGWLLGYLWSPDDDCSEMLVLDAQAPEAPPLARVQLPQRIPFGSHGCWVPG
ncbi:MAG: hypothetical protein EA417_09175 [Gammaproteobacteria bacterium]|nr:MAG: hypothetical protein EA417_09175 [Gammaproteobacteria bacterium]